MNLLLISHSDIGGGAAIACYRLHKALLKQGYKSHLWVRRKLSDDHTTTGPSSKWELAINMMRPTIGNYIGQKFYSNKSARLHSYNILPSDISNFINKSSYDIVHLHWIAGETASIEDLGRIRKPIIATLHDVWPLSGASHYEYSEDAIFRRKKRYWHTPWTLIAPSHWMQQQAQQSSLTQNWPCHVIPNPLDTDFFRPLNKNFCRQIMGLPHDKKFILFGAIGGSKDPNKGWDLLLDALKAIDNKDIHCLVFGQAEPSQPPQISLPIHWLGILHDQTSLLLAYNSADVMVIPSRLDNLPQTATEAQSCGVPVVAFNSGGISDCLADSQTGLLVPPFDTRLMAKLITDLVADGNRLIEFSIRARKRAVEKWSYNSVIPQLSQLYESILNNNESLIQSRNTDRRK